MKTTIEAIVPVRRLLNFPDNPKDFDACLDDFLTHAADVLQKINPKISNCKVTKLESSSDIPLDLTLILAVNRILDVPVEYCHFAIDYLVNEKELSELNEGKAFTESEISGMQACSCSGDIGELLLLASLAYPGRFHTFTGLTFVNGHGMNQIEELSGFVTDYFTTDHVWPFIAHIPLAEVWRWVKKLGIFECGVGDTAIRRAFASYSHTQFGSHHQGYKTLFFAMQGLESFYCRGIGDLRRQLSEKCRIFLGSWSVDKNIVGAAYDLRSKFVHGDFPMAIHGSEIIAEGSVGKAEDDLAEATTLAVRVLVATLHKCIREQVTEVDFKWQIFSS